MKAFSGTWLRGGALLAIVVVLLGVWVQPVAALEVRRGTDVTIASGEVINQDLVIVGNSVTINGTVNGDVWVAGSQVQVNGTVNGRLYWLGQGLQVSGKVGNTLYGAGLSTGLGSQSTVGSDLVLLGSSLTTAPGSKIGQDLVMGGRQALVAGAVARNVRFTGLALQVSGPVGSVTTTPPTARALLENIVAPGRGARSAAIAPQLAAPAQITPAIGWGRWLLTGLRALVTLLALGGLALWLLRRGFAAAADRAQARPLVAVGTGALAWLGGYVAAVLGLIAVLAIGLVLAIGTLGSLAAIALGLGLLGWGLAFAVFLLLVAYGGKLVALYTVGRWIVGRLSGSVREWRGWSLLVGAAIYVLLRAIPYVGIAVSVIATAWGLGGIWLAYRERRRRREPSREMEWAEREEQRELAQEAQQPIPMP
jgi:hypothetical protein